MNITEVSQKYDISADTLRYYERVGLIPTVPRNKSGNREYDEYSCNWVEYVKCMRGAGLPIGTLIKYVSLFQDGVKTAPARRQLLCEQKAVLMAKLNVLTATLERLDNKIEWYDSGEAVKFQRKFYNGEKKKKNLSSSCIFTCNCFFYMIEYRYIE